jgi:hypothetical protein
VGDTIGEPTRCLPSWRRESARQLKLAFCTPSAVTGRLQGAVGSSAEGVGASRAAVRAQHMIYPRQVDYRGCGGSDTSVHK